MKYLILFFWVSLSAFAHEHHSAMSMARAKPSGDSIYNLKSGWTDQDGHKLNLSAFQGHPVVAAMAYTSCQASCPLIVEDMKRIESKLANTKSEPVFVLFSFDSKRDTPAQLKKFAAAHSLNMSHWTLLHGKPGAVRELAAVLGIRYKEDKNGDFDHSNVITLLDTAGVIRFQETGIRQDPTEFTKKFAELKE